MGVSPAIIGACYENARSFEFAFNASGGANVQPAIAAGSYEILCTVDAYVLTGSNPTAAPLPATQPLITASTPLRRAFAGIPFALDISVAGKISAIAVGAAGGTCVVTGPITIGANR